MGRKVKRTTVPDTHKVNPWTGEKICGSFKAHKKAFFEENNLTYEMTLKDRDLFEFLFCQRPPETNQGLGTGYPNDRCSRHGARQGRSAIHGKYSEYWRTLTPEEVENFDKKGAFSDLTSEMAILTKFIQDKLPETVGENASLANISLMRLIGRMEKSFEAMDIAGMREIVKLIRAHCEDAYTAEKAKKDVQQLIKTLSEVFKVETANRALSNLYIPKQQALTNYIWIVSRCSQEITDDSARQTLRREIYAFITGGAGHGVQDIDGTSSQLVRFKDQNEESADNYIDAEFSTDEVPE